MSIFLKREDYRSGVLIVDPSIFWNLIPTWGPWGYWSWSREQWVQTGTNPGQPPTYRSCNCRCFCFSITIPEPVSRWNEDLFHCFFFGTSFSFTCTVCPHHLLYCLLLLCVLPVLTRNDCQGLYCLLCSLSVLVIISTVCHRLYFLYCLRSSLLYVVICTVCHHLYYVLCSLTVLCPHLCWLSLSFSVLFILTCTVCSRPHLSIVTAFTVCFCLYCLLSSVVHIVVYIICTVQHSHCLSSLWVASKSMVKSSWGLSVKILSVSSFQWLSVSNWSLLWHQ